MSPFRALLPLLFAAGCTVDAPSMIPIDVYSNVPVTQVSVDVEQAGRIVQSGNYDWMGGADQPLRIAVLLPPEISGEVLVEVAGSTGQGKTSVRSHPLVVQPGQVAPTVRISLLP